MNTDQVIYYSERAPEYEEIYEKPERQDELAQISHYLTNNFRNKQVKEIACGTGYWTKYISETAYSITASDINDSALEIAKSKSYDCPVEFINEDICLECGICYYLCPQTHILDDELNKIYQFTDFTSMVIMKGLDIKLVLTGDDHFEQTGMGFRKIP